jgi:hypothetical protein
MTTSGDTNGNGTGFPINNGASTTVPSDRAEPVLFKGFAVRYDRTFNLGDHEFLNPAVTIQVKTTMPEGEPFDLHHARERVRRLARENVRAQLLRAQGRDEVVFLGLQPPKDGRDDSVSVESVRVSLVRTVNLANLNSLTLGFTDRMDVQDVAGSPGEMHVTLARMWASLWANVQDEVSRAKGSGSTGAFLGLPPIAASDWTPVSVNPVMNGLKGSAKPVSGVNGRFDRHNSAGNATAANGRR